MRVLGPINLVFLILPDMTYCISEETYYQGTKTYHLGAEPCGVEALLPGRPGSLAIWGATPSFYTPSARPDQLLFKPNQKPINVQDLFRVWIPSWSKPLDLPRLPRVRQPGPVSGAETISFLWGPLYRRRSPQRQLSHPPWP